MWKQSRGCMIAVRVPNQIMSKVPSYCEWKDTSTYAWKMLFTTTDYTQGNCTEPKAPLQLTFK